MSDTRDATTVHTFTRNPYDENLMALCAGYVSPFKCDARVLAERFSSASGASIDASVPTCRIIETNHGHHIVSSISGAINRPSVFKDHAGNVLILLGFVRS